jgi:arsenite-transporting ATPase
MLGTTPTADPLEIAPRLSVVQLQTAKLLERSWEEMKQIEAQYLRTPFFKEVFGQELRVLPGMDSALGLNAIREYDASGNYDVIVYDGTGDQATLRMLGMPEMLSWYLRRFRQVFVNSDLGKVVTPLLQPIAASVLNVSWSGDIFNQPATQQVNDILEQGKQAVADPTRVVAYLITTGDEVAIATAKYLLGAAQQAGLTVGGVILNQARGEETLEAEFAPLPVHPIPVQAVNDWQPLIDALPRFDQATQVPRPIAINTAERKVSLFLPGFDKTQVKLTQYGPEITIEAGDQRRNIFLPPELSGKPVAAAKFQDSFLIISF